MQKVQAEFQHPHDTFISGMLRFAVEVLAWVTAPLWVSGFSVGLALLVALILVVLPALFSTPNDKRQVIVSTPGPARLVIEMILFVIAGVAPWGIWPVWSAVSADVLVIVALWIGWPRLVWLARGAPATPP